MYSCKKALSDVNDYLPKVTTVSAVKLSSGDVLVTGKINSPGESDGSQIEYSGVCMGTHSNLKISEGQIICSLDGTGFFGLYPASDFNADSVYYFLAWATNEYGYSVGNALRLDSIEATPLTPPCNLTMNRVSIGGGNPNYSYNQITGPDADNVVSGTSFSGPSVTFKFGSTLSTGIYKTINDPSPSAGFVYISFFEGFISGSLSSGSDVYVNRISGTSYEITICSAPWIFNSSTFYFDSRLVTP